jgi:exonuclease SbcD
MKILHTADWHIGKKLHKHDLHQDFQLFIQWLEELVRAKEIDVVLVSGDIFDLANPSNEARRAYYQALLKLNQLSCKVILTGGNHDSPSVLNAPKEILAAMDIHVIGHLPASIDDCLIPLANKAGEIEAIVAALPYLRDPDLREASENFGYESRVEAVREGITRVFAKTAERCAVLYPQIPAIAMGHLFAAGASTTESEREIQIGNEASFDASNFGNYFRYIALGHIHRPQIVKAQVPAFYSGSPLPLSFSERKDQKRLLIFDTDNFEAESIEIPLFRALKRISGSLEELRNKLDALHTNSPLTCLVELELVEDEFNPARILDLDQLVQNFQAEGIEIVKHRASFKNQLRGSAQLYDGTQQLQDLKPREVFEKRLEHEDYDDETKALLQEAFDEILEEIQNAD